MTNLSEPQTYETLYARMQAIVAQLEAGELPLEAALALYEEGVAVAAACQHMLDAAGLRFKNFRQASGGGLAPGRSSPWLSSRRTATRAGSSGYSSF